MLTDTSLSVTVHDVAPTVSLVGPTSAGNGQLKHYTFSSTDPAGVHETFSLVGITVTTLTGGATGVVSGTTFNPADGSGSFDVTFSVPPGAARSKSACKWPTTIY